MSIPKTWRGHLRLPSYDYASIGSDFVTICIQNRACVLGTILDGTTQLSAVGEMAQNHLFLAIDRYADVALDMHVVMPNHLHALINIGWKTDPPPDAVFDNESRHGGLQLRGYEDSPNAPDLSRIMQWFKSATTNEYIRRVRTDRWPRFPGRLWQQNYHDHIVRDKSDLDRIRHYIANNPGKWAEDKEYSPTCRGF